MSARFWSTAAGKPFFQPLDLHVEPADLLEEFGLAGLPLFPLAAATVAEEGLDVVQEMLLPLADLDGMDLERRAEFGGGPGLLGRFQSDLRLEGRRVSLPRTGHDSPRDGTVTFDQFNIPSCPVSGVHFSNNAPFYNFGYSSYNGLVEISQFSRRRSAMPVERKDFDHVTQKE